MEYDNSYLAIIPARGGSKGLLRKNLLPFCGKPLIAWTIEQALASKSIERVLVSTDCQEIAKVALAYGAEVPGLRPPEISTDHSTTEEVLLHVCSQLVHANNCPKNIVLLQCTSPIRLPGTIDRAICEYVETGADSLVSVAKSHRFIWYNKSSPQATYNYTARPRRQDISEEDCLYMETGSIYVTDFDMLIEHSNRLCGNICMFETAYLESFEIDNLDDFELCEYLARKVLINANS
jgi:N-acylneuraminate cytidylyltransferase